MELARSDAKRDAASIHDDVCERFCFLVIRNGKSCADRSGSGGARAIAALAKPACLVSMSSIICHGSHKPGLNCVAFNQDASCIVVATSEGVRIYSVDTHQICYRYNVGAVG